MGGREGERGGERGRREGEREIKSLISIIAFIRADLYSYFPTTD